MIIYYFFTLCYLLIYLSIYLLIHLFIYLIYLLHSLSLNQASIPHTSYMQARSTFPHHSSSHSYTSPLPPLSKFTPYLIHFSSPHPSSHPHSHTLHLLSHPTLPPPPSPSPPSPSPSSSSSPPPESTWLRSWWWRWRGRWST